MDHVFSGDGNDIISEVGEGQRTVVFQKYREGRSSTITMCFVPVVVVAGGYDL